MSTATVEVTITCPEWCEIEPEAHAEELTNMGGDCLHLGTDEVSDLAGYSEPLKAPRFYEPIPVTLIHMRRLNGAPAASAVLRVGDTEMSLLQARYLAEAITTMVAAYEAAGGVIETASKGV